jgi:hypothetical protein
LITVYRGDLFFLFRSEAKNDLGMGGRGGFLRPNPVIPSGYSAAVGELKNNIQLILSRRYVPFLLELLKDA